MKKLLSVFAAIVLVLGMAAAAKATLVNGGFETGDFTGWTKYVPYGGSAQVVTSHNGDKGKHYTPVEGNYFALLKTDGPGSYTTISQTIHLEAGWWVEGYAAFDARDWWNDKAWVKIYDSTNGDLIATLWYSDVNQVGDFGDGPWTYWSWTANESGDYILKFGVANAGDYSYDSYALFDATASATPIPEPTTLLLLGSGLIGLAGIGRRKFK